MPAKTNLILDLSIFSAFLVATYPGLTRITVHEWFGIALAAAIVTHLLFHWKWLLTMTRQSLTRAISAGARKTG